MLTIVLPWMMWASVAQVQPVVPNALPSEWMGRWQGELVIAGPMPRKTVPMQLVIEPKGTNRYSWAITYDSGLKASLRDYDLIARPGKPGEFQIDEKNGIILDARLFDGTLYSLFQTPTTMIESRYRLVGNALEVEIVTFSTNAIASAERATGSPVRCYPIVARQVARLVQSAKPATSVSQKPPTSASAN